MTYRSPARYSEHNNPIFNNRHRQWEQHPLAMTDIDQLEQDRDGNPVLFVEAKFGVNITDGYGDLPEYIPKQVRKHLNLADNYLKCPLIVVFYYIWNAAGKQIEENDKDQKVAQAQYIVFPINDAAKVLLRSSYYVEMTEVQYVSMLYQARGMSAEQADLICMSDISLCRELRVLWARERPYTFNKWFLENYGEPSRIYA